MLAFIWTQTFFLLYFFVTGRRRKSSHKPLVLSEACKQLLIYRLPQVLRLHLKRFRQVFNPTPSTSPCVMFVHPFQQTGVHLHKEALFH